MLRYESPVQVLFRVTTRDVGMNGVTIPADERVGVFYGAANRDPEEWEEPDEFMLERDLHAHVGSARDALLPGFAAGAGGSADHAERVARPVRRDRAGGGAGPADGHGRRAGLHLATGVLTGA